ncbi:MAG: Gfo/Idh/MocA family protein, partial [Caldilineaceae bacterium]
MVAAVARAGVPAQMTFHFRFFPAISRAQELVASGFLGRIFSFHGRYFRSSYIDPNKPISWKQLPEKTGGGALVDIGSHILDLLYAVLGQEYATVQATLETLIRERPAAAGSAERVAVEVDDLALLHLRTAHGALGTVEISRVATGASNDLGFEIYGERGALRWRQTEPGWLEVYDVGASPAPHGGMRGFTRVEALARYDGHKAPDASMVPDFVRAHAECQYQFLKSIWQARPAVPSLADGLHIQAVLQAAQRSAAQGGWVSVFAQLEGDPLSARR